MIFGVGTDIVKTERVKNLGGKGYLCRLFTKDEILHCEESRSFYESAAGIFAAKEAVAKAIGKGVLYAFRHSEIIFAEGKPFVKLNEDNGMKISLSISHDGEYAVAFVVAEVD